MSTGLVLGKFAPLHTGHRSLIEKSLMENDKTVLIIYDCPEVTDVSISKRVGWIRQLYPKVEIIEAWGCSNEVSRSPKVKREHEQVILRLLNGRKIDNFYSSEFYGRHVSKALGAKDVRVDEDRIAFPISGTEIREDPFKNRGFLSPVVYRDLIKRVLFLGAPSSGKTTLCRALAKKYNTLWVPEYGRQYWARFNKNRRLTIRQLDTIARTHRDLVLKATMKVDGFLFVDTDASTTRIFARYYHGVSSRDLDSLTNLSRDDYDKVFLCDIDFPFDDTEDRSGEVSRILFQRQIIEDLEYRKIPYLVVKGTVEERLSFACQNLDCVPY